MTARPNHPAKVISDLARIVEALEARGRLVRVRSEVESRHQLISTAK